MKKIIISLTLAALIFTSCNNPITKSNEMSEQKQIVEKYMDGFRATDHQKILSCLTDDVIWELPGYYLHHGKAAFDKEIENPNAEGHPDIKIIRLVEEGNIVIAEGTVKAKFKDGNKLDAVFCDVFHFTNGKISKLTSYLMFKK
ncbi:nuclear transport factor 2 family protein [Flavobacterium sp.]|uniref:nuclear transport factor 2 family protein n=1 Tax=Flavobacterium sp. TaxID=239 RepID=UPI0039E705AB